MERVWSSFAELRAKLVAELETRHPGLVTELTLRLDGDMFILEGEVGSEDCKGDAKRLLLSFEAVFKVHNRLVVAAFLEPASDGMDDYFRVVEMLPNLPSSLTRGYRPGKPRASAKRRPSHGPSSQPAAATVEVERYPKVDATGTLGPGHEVVIEVDLTTLMDDGTPSISLGQFPADWESIDIRVQLFAPWAAEMSAEADHIVVRADRASQRARFRLRVADGHAVGTSAPIFLSFYHGTRICGHLQDDLANRTSATPAPAAEAVIAIVPDAPGPALSVSIACTGDVQTWMWRAQVPGGTEEGSEQIRLEGGDRAFADSLLRTCPDLSPNAFRRTLAGLGERLWSKAPASFKSAYIGWRTRIGPAFPIQFVSDDPHVPWEMMKPDDAGIDHLFLGHPVARWPLSKSARRRHKLPGGVMLSFVPRYAPPDDLPSAQIEGEWLRVNHGAMTMAADSTAFLDVLDGNHSSPVGIIHFAGHGQVDTGIADGGIHLEDRAVGVGEVGQSRVVLGRKDGTLIILNACETGAGAQLLGMNTGWGAAIAAREFGGLIAPLWEVEDAMALTMLQAFVPPLVSGHVGLGEAVRAARQASCETSVSAFAYLAHGDVMATFAR